MDCAIAFFKEQSQRDHLAAIGIGSFGPVDPNPASSTFGFITTTPKPGWAHTDFAGTVRRALSVPVGFDTDVNIAGLGENRWGAAQGLDTFIYLTIGTGIGGGGLLNGKMMHGLVHPEMGHIRIPHDWAADPYAGFCPYHGDCFEGLANGPAIEKRLGVKGATVPESDPFWDIEADYIAAALMNYILTLSPRKIILGGGVMGREYLFPKIRQRVQKLLNGYVVHKNLLEDIDNYIVPPALGNKSGSMGAIALARLAE